jgi:cellulose synthase/poly-beta-1,6-N-acetylglucosamine synthase-like glycosyltransferase
MDRSFALSSKKTTNRPTTEGHPFFNNYSIFFDIFSIFFDMFLILLIFLIFFEVSIDIISIFLMFFDLLDNCFETNPIQIIDPRRKFGLD